MSTPESEYPESGTGPVRGRGADAVGGGVVTAPLARSLPVLALYLAALKLGLFTIGRKKRPSPDARQLPLVGVEG